MLAVRLQAAGAALTIEDVPLPEPTGTQVRVRVAGCGVCHTDLHIAAGELTRVELPITLGHEVAGWVDAWGPEASAGLRRARLRAGDAVLVYGGWGCGACDECGAGNEQRCLSGSAPGFQVDGGYAEAMIVPDPRYLVPLGRLDPVRAAPLADAGLTPYRAVRRAAPWLVPGSRILLIGFGGLGQFLLQYLRRLPDLVVVVREVAPDKVALATELGADLALLAGDAAMVLHGLGAPADVVFDAVGTDASLDLARSVAGPGGLIMLLGEAGGHLPVGMDGTALEAWVTTTAWGSLDELREVVQLARRRSLRWTIEAMPLRQAREAHERLAAGKVAGRLVLVPDR